MAEPYIPQSRVRQVFFLGLLILLGGLLAKELYGFLPALLGAITLYVVCRKWMLYLVEKRKWKKGGAAALLMFLAFIVILLPIAALVKMLSSKVQYVIDHANELTEAMKKLLSELEGRLGFELISPDNLQNIGLFAAQTVPKILGATFDTLGTIFFMFFILFFMLTSGRKMEEGVYDFMPLKDENVDKVGKEFHNLVLSNAVGIPLIALLQGIVAVIGYLLMGVKEPWFWFGVTCLTSMLPVIGAAMAYVPLAIIFFANGQTLLGIIMLVFGFGIIGLVDNVFRFTLARKIGNVHPLITIFGVIIGLKLFGFIGLVFGPLMISLFILMIKIYSAEFIVNSKKVQQE